MSFDLRAYLNRVGIREALPPTLESLRQIHLAHVQTIAFENLNPLLGLPVSLELADIERKLVHSQRGGYCFEQNLLLRAALEHLSFDVRPLLARVLWGGQVSPRTHVLLLVTVADGPYIADVGFGGMTLTGPIALERDVDQSTPHERFRLTLNDREWTLESQVRDAWQPLYQFDLSSPFPIDLEAGNWYCATHPKSPFTFELKVARPAPGCRHTLRRNELTTHWLDGRTEKRVLRQPSEVAGVLTSVFDLKLPEHPRLADILKNATAGTHPQMP